MTATAVVPVETPASTAVQVRPASSVRLLRPVAGPADLIAQQNETRAFVKEVLQEGRDYGKIPGIDKATLLKPGAEKVTLGFGCVATQTIIEREIDHDRRFPWVKRKAQWGRDANEPTKRVKLGEEVVEGESVGLYRYVVRVDIIDQDGQIRGSGVGSCSTMESKYIDRPRDSENTVLKMATKRAHIAAVLGTFGLSDEFTQDVEDMPHLAKGATPAAAGGASSERDPRDTVMKFGFAGVKGKQLGELKDDALINAIEWATKNNKFPEIVADCRAVLKQREDEARAVLAQGAATPATEGSAPAAPVAKRAAGFEDFPEAMEGDDDLPF